MALKNFYQKELIEAGCDEAGRGCLAGPVVAAAVILPPGFRHPLLNDSKKMTERERDLLEPIIKQKALAYAVGIVEPEEIDRINILNASFLAMHLAVDKLVTKPGMLLIDGNRFKPYSGIPHTCIIKGDGKFKSIAAASVLAKVCRDHLMKELHEKHPEYGWAQNMGYPTTAHRKAIAQYGVTPYHRLSFTLLPQQDQLSLEF